MKTSVQGVLVGVSMILVAGCDGSGSSVSGEGGSTVSGCKLRQSIRLSSADVVAHPATLKDVEVGSEIRTKYKSLPSSGLVFKMTKFKLFGGGDDWLGGTLTDPSRPSASVGITGGNSFARSQSNNTVVYTTEYTDGSGEKLQVVMDGNDLTAVELSVEGTDGKAHPICLQSAKLDRQD